MTLKSELQELTDNIILEQIDLNVLIEKMLSNIGSTDPELRDKLIFNTFCTLIEKDYLNKNQMEHIIEVCLNNLFLGIDKIESDLVFTRSFSSLTIGLLLQKDREQSFLKEEVVLSIINKSTEYLNLEKDIRGYVETKGWAHSIAHGADLLVEAVKHPLFNNNLSSVYLETIKECLFKKSTTKAPFVDGEEERLIVVLEALIEKGLTTDEMITWISEISNTLNNLKSEEGYSLNFFWKRSNVINFLRGLYFRLLYKNTHLKLRSRITDILEQLHKQMYGSV